MIMDEDELMDAEMRDREWAEEQKLMAQLNAVEEQ
jgi:hypothetical protein